MRGTVARRLRKQALADHRVLNAYRFDWYRMLKKAHNRHIELERPPVAIR